MADNKRVELEEFRCLIDGLSPDEKVIRLEKILSKADDADMTDEEFRNFVVKTLMGKE